MTKDTPIEDLDMPVRAYNALHFCFGVKTFADVGQVSWYKVCCVKNCGRKTQKWLLEMAEALGVRFSS